MPKTLTSTQQAYYLLLLNRNHTKMESQISEMKKRYRTVFVWF